MQSQENNFEQFSSSNPDQVQIQKLLEDYGRGFREKNIELLLSAFAEDSVCFYEMNSLHISGGEALRKFWQDCIDSSGTNDFVIHGLRLVIDQSVAFAHYLTHLTCLSREGDKINHWSRCSLALRKYNDKWLMTHEHTSVRVDEKSGLAIWNAEHADFIEQ